MKQQTRTTARRYDPHARRRRVDDERDPGMFLLTAQVALCAVLVLLGYAAVDASPPFLPALTRQYRLLITEPQTPLSVSLTLPAQYRELRDTLADAASGWITGLREREQSPPSAAGAGGWMGVPDGDGRMPPESCAYQPITVSARVDPPIGGRVTSTYGYRSHPVTGAEDFHRGVDVAAAAGSAIRASLPGRVSEVGQSQIYGNYITLDHGGGLQTTYCHCAEIIAPVDANLRRGELVATVGSTGISTGPHCHFEVRMNGTYYDPAWVLDGMRQDGV